MAAWLTIRTVRNPPQMTKSNISAPLEDHRFDKRHPFRKSVSRVGKYDTSRREEGIER